MTNDKGIVVESPEISNQEDFRAESSGHSRKPEQTKVAKKYDARPGEDKARRRIAYALILILGTTIVGILLLVAFNRMEIDEIKEFAVVLGPLVTLVSAATGFYYGTKANQSEED